jgi:hypothetical protein
VLQEFRAWLPDLRARAQEDGPGRDQWLYVLCGAETTLGQLDVAADYEVRLQHFERGYAAALEYCEVSEDPDRFEELLWACVSGAHFLIGAQRSALAVEWLKEARTLCPETSSTLPYLWLAMAEAQRQLGSYQDAFDAVESGRALLPEHAHALRAELAGMSGLLHLELGILDQAARELALGRRELAQRDPSTIPTPDFVAVAADLCRINLLAMQQQYETAESEAKRLLDNEPRYAPGTSWRASLELQRARALACIAFYRRAGAKEALELLEQASKAPGLPELDLLLAELNGAWLRMNVGDLSKAGALLESADQRLLAREPDAEQSDSMHRPRPERAQLAALEARLALMRGDDVEALQLHCKRLEGSLKDLCTQWSSLNLRTGGIGFLGVRLRCSVLSELARVYVRLEGRERGAELALQAIVSAQALGTLERRLNAPAATLEEIREELLLPLDHGILLYLPGPDQSHVFAIDRDTLGYDEFSGDRALHEQLVDHAAKLASLRSSALDRRSDALERERLRAQELAKELLPEGVRKQVLSWKALTVVGSELLDELQFEALPLRDGKPAGQSYALDYLPSVPLGLALARRPAPEATQRDLVLVAAPQAGGEARARWPELVPLDLSKESLGRLCGNFPEARTAVLTKRDATWTALSLLEPSNARILCFLGHAVNDSSRERPIGLVFAPGEEDDGLVWCEEVEVLPSPELIVLMACASGQAPLRSADAAAPSQDGAFFAAGARVVVSTRADVLLEPATLLTERLLGGLVVGGTSPAAALRDARRALAREDDGAAAWMNAVVRVSGLGQFAR